MLQTAVHDRSRTASNTDYLENRLQSVMSLLLRDAVRGKIHHLPHPLLSTLWFSRMLLRARDTQEKYQDSSNTHQT